MRLSAAIGVLTAGGGRHPIPVAVCGARWLRSYRHWPSAWSPDNRTLPRGGRDWRQLEPVRLSEAAPTTATATATATAAATAAATATATAPATAAAPATDDDRR